MFVCPHYRHCGCGLCLRRHSQSLRNKHMKLRVTEEQRFSFADSLLLYSCVCILSRYYERQCQGIYLMADMFCMCCTFSKGSHRFLHSSFTLRTVHPIDRQLFLRLEAAYGCLCLRTEHTICLQLCPIDSVQTFLELMDALACAACLQVRLTRGNDELGFGLRLRSWLRRCGGRSILRVPESSDDTFGPNTTQALVGRVALNGLNSTVP